jgi:hypothetical protein
VVLVAIDQWLLRHPALSNQEVRRNLAPDPLNRDEMTIISLVDNYLFSQIDQEDFKLSDLFTHPPFL